MSTIDLPAREELALDDDAPTVVREPPHVPKSDPAPVSPRRARRRTSSITASLLWTSAAVSGLALWFVLHALVLTSLQAHGSQSRLRAEFREKLGLATAPLGGTIKLGSPVARLDLGMAGSRSLMVVEGTTSRELTLGPGHLSDTPLPGQPGVSVIFGRSVTYGAPFRSIMRLGAGDNIKVITGQGVFTYRVDRLRLPGDLLPPPLAENGSRLMLVTSAGSGWRRGWAPAQMVFLDATLEGSQVQPAPGRRPTAVTKSALPMRGDMGVLVLVVFWLQALLLVSAGLAWAWIRWGPWQTWAVGLPVALAVLWGASGTAMQLLPNLI